MTKSNCANCYFWDLGVCRANPPTVHTLVHYHPQYMRYNKDDILTLWPKTRPEEWCGYFRQKEQHQ